MKTCLIFVLVLVLIQVMPGAAAQSYSVNNQAVSENELVKMIEDKFLDVVNQYRQNPYPLIREAREYYKKFFADAKANQTLDSLLNCQFRPLNSLNKAKELSACCRQHIENLKRFPAENFYENSFRKTYAHENYLQARWPEMKNVIAKNYSKRVKSGKEAGGEIIEFNLPLVIFGGNVSIEKTALRILYSFIASNGHRHIIEINYEAGSYFGTAASLVNLKQTPHLFLDAAFVGISE